MFRDRRPFQLRVVAKHPPVGGSHLLAEPESLAVELGGGIEREELVDLDDGAAPAALERLSRLVSAAAFIGSPVWMQSQYC